MGKIWKFKNGNKTFYAVTGIFECTESIRAVIRYKKESLSTINNFDIRLGRLRKRHDRWELWSADDINEGKLCWIITKK